MNTRLLYLYFLIFIFQAPVVGDPVPDLTLMVPMRDGTELPTDLYLPSPQARGLPCILLRSPAGRQAPYWKEIAKLAKEGYVVVIQDTRSVLDLEGKTLPFISDGWGKLQDGYDTVEWLARSSYTNGKIGTWGASALGITQLLMAPSQPPHLMSQYILVAAASIYHHALFPGGQLLKNQAEGWLGLYARDTGVQCYVCQFPFYNDFWKQLNSLEVSDHVNVPAIHVGGWYDTFLQGTLASFSARHYHGGEGALGRQKLVIGPWTHFWPLSEHFGDFEVPKAGVHPPVDISPKRWFDYYLKGISNGAEELSPVTYYVMGPFDGTSSSGNVWRTSDEWPVLAKQTPFYLTTDFRLQVIPPSDQGEASYRYDPNHPIPTTGGRNLFLESGPKDQRSIEGRSDILVFTSAKLEEDSEVTGPLTATLFFSSDQQDTDIVVRLCDVYPDGRSILISEGGCRLGLTCYPKQATQRFRANEIFEIKVDLWATSLVFAKGHAIRLSVSSSSYPRYEKNRNIGLLGVNTGKYHVAQNKLYMGKKYPSRLILPVVQHDLDKTGSSL
jgi:predicted acyl esterase